MNRRTYLVFAVLLVLLVTLRAMYGGTQPLSIWEVWDAMRPGK